MPSGPLGGGKPTFLKEKSLGGNWKTEAEREFHSWEVEEKETVTKLINS